MRFRLFNILTVMSLISSSTAFAAAPKCEFVFARSRATYLPTDQVTYLLRAVNENSSSPNDFALVKNGWIETSHGLVRAGANQRGFMSGKELVTSLLERQQKLANSNPQFQPAFDSYRAELLQAISHGDGYLRNWQLAEISLQTTIYLAAVVSSSGMKEAFSPEQMIKSGIEARRKVYGSSYKSFFEQNLKVPKEFPLDPKSFVQGGSRQFQSKAGDLYLLTEQQIAQLPKGTKLYDYRTGEEVLAGIYPLSKERINGFTVWGTPR